MENQKKSFDYKWIIICVLVIALFLMQQACSKQQQDKDTQTELVNHLNDSLKTWVDKDGNNRATMTILEAENTKMFTGLQNQSVEIQRLQALVKKNDKYLKPGGSATIISTEGGISITIPTIPSDTSKSKCTENHIFPSEFNLNGWVKGNIVARKDSTSISLKYRDSIDVVLGREKTGFLGLGKGKPFADLTSHNPYTEIKTFRTFQVKEKPAKKIGIGPGVYYGIGSGFIPQVFIGIGIQFNFIRF